MRHLSKADKRDSWWECKWGALKGALFHMIKDTFGVFEKAVLNPETSPFEVKSVN